MHNDHQDRFNAVFTFLFDMLINAGLFFDVWLESFLMAALAFYIIILYANVRLVQTNIHDITFTLI